MKHPPQFPLLRLDPPKVADRKKRKSFVRARQFGAAEQAARPVGQRMQHLTQFLNEDRDPLELRQDPAGLAPERLLVFELTGDIQNFARAAAYVPGLEMVSAEDIEADEVDKNAVLYLMVPNAAALRQLTTLWQRWQADAQLPEGFAPWRALFSQLRDIRPWGPADRLSPQDRAMIAAEHLSPEGMVRLELELVYRRDGITAEQDAVRELAAVGGNLVSRARIEGAAYHALLVDVPNNELARIVAGGNEGLLAAESVMHIRPQSAVHLTVFESDTVELPQPEPPPEGLPIAAIFDAVPLAGHPRLVNRLSIDDPFNLEPIAVGSRLHGTAMASAIVHGDLEAPPSNSLGRRVFFVNVMYAPPAPDTEERFPDRLPADLFAEAVVRMKEGANAVAPTVIIVNASIGDRNKPFSGRISGWARVVDYLAHRYGLLFVISAGNHLDALISNEFNTIAFEALDPAGKARSALRSSAAEIGRRRVLAPAESMNALTVGALHDDNVGPQALPASTFDVWRDTGLCTVSSGLGPGYGNAVKPDILAPGGRHHVRLMPNGGGHRLTPLGPAAGTFGGIRVAVPPAPTDVSPDRTGRSVGTSVAAALMTGLAARVHEVLEAVYDDFIAIPAAQRAVLLKALLVHGARWTRARDLIVEILGPADPRQHVRQKDNVRRYLGYGAVEAAMVLDCAQDRATLWAVGSLAREQAHQLFIPLPVAMSGQARPHEVAMTVSWFAPPRVGAVRYRGVRLKLNEPENPQAVFGVKASSEQPDTNQAHSGTVIHRRWAGEKAPVIGADSSLEFTLQRQPDEIDELVPYAAVATVVMPGIAEVYAQVRNRIALKPKVLVPA